MKYEEIFSWTVEEAAKAFFRNSKCAGPELQPTEFQVQFLVDMLRATADTAFQRGSRATQERQRDMTGQEFRSILTRAMDAEKKAGDLERELRETLATLSTVVEQRDHMNGLLRRYARATSRAREAMVERATVGVALLNFVGELPPEPEEDEDSGPCST